jgi:hypothetical protein
VLRIAYADPPYPGQSRKHYGDHPDYDGEVCHADLVSRLVEEFDGWILHTSSPALRDVLAVCPPGVRVAAWVKPFAAFKKGVPVAYAWEPVIFSPARKAEVSAEKKRSLGFVSRDWLDEPITMKRGLAGAKPERVVWWALHIVGAVPGDEIVDMFPGTGAVSRAALTWAERLSGYGHQGTLL